MTAAPAVETKDLVKVFERGRRTIWQRLRGEPDKRGRFRAVNEIDLVVEPGGIFGLLGPNGAGKTTTMKMLATLLIPTSGTIRVLGIDPLERPREVRARLGAMLSGERSLYWKLTARENLEYFAALYRVPTHETRARVHLLWRSRRRADQHGVLGHRVLASNGDGHGHPRADLAHADPPRDAGGRPRAR
jgi:ABC-2 type transport system ATP-binding protein